MRSTRSFRSKNARANDLTRISRLVGREGRLTERLDDEGYDGSWAQGVRTVNALIDDLGRPTTEIARVIAAVAEGDLSQHMANEIEGRPLRGEFLQIGRTVNTMVDQLSSFADEVTRVARDVGTEGKLGGQADVRGVSGTWRDLTANVNLMAANLTNQVRSISQVTTAIAHGDLSQKITVSAKGEVAELTDTINSLTDTLRVFAEQVTRVAREVGTEGKLGGQAEVPNVGGTWKDLTDNVNSMASNLTSQVRNIAQVATAVAQGDLSQKITVAAQGEILELKNTVNTMVDQLSSFADEVTRVAREVGTEGKLGGQALVPGVGGTWKDLTENVNQLAGNLTAQVRNIAQVTTAVARGDLSQKITVDARGEILALKSTVNTMVDQLSSFADEVTRVAREVGTEGKLGGQAQVTGVSGTWRDLTDNVNSMASNLTSQVRNIAQVATAVANGDLSQKITVDVRGEILELKSTVNTMVDQLSSFADEVTRVAREVGTEGKLGGQAQVRGVAGTWRDLTDNVNFMASNLTSQVRNIAQVATAVARGDLSQKITVAAQGEILELKSTVNTMVDQLSSFADEVTRVAREVGTEGKLGGQAQVKGVSGTWRDLTDNVNSMGSNLTAQVRNIAQVTTAVARGDLSQKITVDAQGEILELKSTVNTMVDQLSSFADEVTRVAREVGTEGKLGGQAQVQGVAGTWRDLTENVNQLASTLTTQLRAIAEVSTAVTRGDMTQRIAVEAMGEVADLKDNINQMIVTLRETTKKNAEQGWLDSNLARIGGLMQSQRDLNEVCRMIMTEVTPLVDAQLGAFFLASVGDRPMLALRASYAQLGEEADLSFAIGEGLIGQAGASRRRIRVTPSESSLDSRLSVRSGARRRGTGRPRRTAGAVRGRPARRDRIRFGEPVLRPAYPVPRPARCRAWRLAQHDSREPAYGGAAPRIPAPRARDAAAVRRNAADERRAGREGGAAERAEREHRVEEPRDRARPARARGEGAAARGGVAVQVRVPREHEPRTAYAAELAAAARTDAVRQRGCEPDAEADRLCPHDPQRRIRSARADRRHPRPVQDRGGPDGHRAGRDPVRGHPRVRAAGVRTAGRGEGPRVHGRSSATNLPDAMFSDPQRVQQILRNLLANAVKFTGSGSVTLAIDTVPGTAVPSVAFSVTDTGIGIADDKLALVFEAFQQADGTTSRRYGGTGLGLSISLELARVLGGAITVVSSTDEGSTFTFTVPMMFRSAVPSSSDVVSTPYSEPAAVIEPSRSTPSILRGAPSQRFDAATSAKLSGITVLIVDDDVRNVFALTSVLELHGMEVLYADNGADGVRTLTEESGVDIVLMDAMMPEQDGYETTRAIRRNPTFADLPVVFLTAKAMPGDRESAIAAGASDYITKPVDLDELLAMMARWVGVKELTAP